jgi:tripartite-type tricarboxylate transporter receptor subunit TctC
MTVSTMKTTLLAGAAVLVGATGALAQDQDFSGVELPGTIRVIVAYSAGGSSDTLARVTIPAWEAAIEELSGGSTNTVIANMPGAGGEIGWTNLAAATPDGSTIGIINLPAVPLVEKTREVAFAPWTEKFVPLGLNVVDPSVVRLAKSSDYETLGEAIEAAKENPGSVIVGADGPLSDDHAAMYALEQDTGAKFTFVPFAGSAPANQSFMSGEVDIAIGNAFDHIQTADAAREAMVLQPERYDMMPDVPTSVELLDLPERDLGSSRGFAAPAGTPEELVELYRAGFAKVFADEAFIEEARGKNITTAKPRVGEEFGALMTDLEALATDLLPLFEEGGFLD